jgi:16S rRNA processing protein RimM
MKKETSVRIGHIDKTHGTNGAVLITIAGVDAYELQNMKTVFLEISQGLVPFFFKTMKVANNALIAEFEDYNTHEKAKQLLGLDVYLSNEQMPQTADDGFYAHEIKGYQIRDVNHGLIGIANNILDYSSNILIQAFDGDKEILIPFNDSYVVNINKRRKIIEVNLPDGLLDLNN